MLPRAPRQAAGVALLAAGLWASSCHVSSVADNGGLPPTDFELVCDVDASLQLLSAAPLRGDVELALQVSSPRGEQTLFLLRVSQDAGRTWSHASLRGLDGRGPYPAPNGYTVGVVWDSLTDLGPGQFDGLALEAIPYIACGPGQSSTITELSVTNEQPRCTVALDAIAGPRDGVIPIVFTLAHPHSARASAQSAFIVEAEGDPRPLTLALCDCDADGEQDDGTWLRTSPGGERHCIIWDSQRDLVSDERVAVQVSCWVGGEAHGSASSEPFEVHNDPAPRPGDLAITEMLLKSAHPRGTYLELYNGTGHVLDLQGVEVQRWAAAQDPLRDGPRNSFVVSDVAGTVPLKAGAYAVLSGAQQPETSGCVVADIRAPPTFALNDDSVYRLAAAAVTLLQLNVTEQQGWDFEEGRAWGLDPAAQEQGAASSSGWCEQRSGILPCAEGVYTETGTPGLPNDTCEP